MGFFSFNKRIKHRTFDYTPRYYDPKKEELKERMEQYKKNKDEVDLEKTKRRISSGMRAKYRADSNFKKQQTRNSNIRLIIIFMVILVLTYFVLISDGLLRFLENI